MTQAVQKTDGTTTIKGADGKIVDNVSAAALAGPNATTGVTVAAPKSTGKAGVDNPPLVVEIPTKYGRSVSRYYVLHPDHKEDALRLGADAAIEQGVAFPSITTCIGVLDKPALIPWAVGLTADAAEKAIWDVVEAGSDDDRERIAAGMFTVADTRTGRTAINKELRAAHKEKKDSAAARGTDVHSICEAIAQGSDPHVPDELSGYVEGYLAFREEYPDMVFEWTEATVAGEGFMGTTDAIVTLNGKRYILDLKTNKNGAVYSTVGMQLSAGANATLIVHSDGRTEPLPKIDGGLALGLAPNGTWKLYSFETAPNGENHRGFKAALSAWHWKRTSGKDPKPLSPGSL
jgi:hypothetical protein